MQSRRLPDIPCVADIAEHGEGEFVGAEREVTQQSTEQRDGHAVLSRQRCSAATLHRAGRIPAHRKRAERRPRLPESEVHAALRHTTDGQAIGNRSVQRADRGADRKSTRLNSSHLALSYAVFCLKKKTSPCLGVAPKQLTFYLNSALPRHHSTQHA